MLRKHREQTGTAQVKENWSGFSRQGAVAATLANNWLVGLPPEFLGTYVGKAQAVTAEQVREMGRKYYPSRHQSLVIVGERKAIQGDLDQFGEFVDYR